VTTSEPFDYTPEEAKERAYLDMINGSLRDKENLPP
jgi:hypothetical protein